MVLTDLPLTPSRPISFSDADIMAVHFPHNDALIINIIIGNCRVSKVLVDEGSFVNILYGGAPNRMEGTQDITRAMITQTPSHQYGFGWYETYSPGTVALPFCADPYNIIMEFYMVDVESPHNAILERLWHHMMKLVPSTYHQLVWYPSPTGNRRHKRRPSHVQDHLLHYLEEVWLEAKDHEGSL